MLRIKIAPVTLGDLGDDSATSDCSLARKPLICAAAHPVRIADLHLRFMFDYFVFCFIHARFVSLGLRFAFE
jgi:hypothetical protein